MKLNTRSVALVLAGAVIGGSLTLTQHVMGARNGEDLPLEQMRTFTDVFSRIKNDYVEEVTDEELLEYAIRGMLNGLDPHSAYLNAEEFNDLRIGTTGEFGGLGIEVGMEDGFVRVVSPIDDTPAARAGILWNRMLEDGFGYLRISNFQTKTTADMLKAIKELNAQAPDGNVRGLVLDLRNNPGGVLSGAVGVSDAFLNDGMIVYTDGRESDSKLRYDATNGDVINGAPLVVLVNGGSASASEIVAGAMQDHGRGVVLGSKTFGKGSVQTIQDLPAGGAVKLTTSRYYTPNGRSIQALGIEPDILTKPGSWVRPDQEDDFTPLSESSLRGSLTNEKDEASSAAADAQEGESTEDNLVYDDYQLFEALNLLKGLTILSKKAS